MSATEPATPAAAPLSRAFEAKIDDVSRPRRSVTAKINTANVDRYRTVIVPAGGDFRRFTQTPAVLWEHGQDPTRGRQPVGHCSSIKYRKAEDDILAVTAFKADEYSDRIFEDYASGTLTSFSIDFLPAGDACSRPTPDEVRAHPDWGTADFVYRKWELTGYSAVSYPGNPEALALAVERGLWVPDEVRRSLPPPKAARTMVEGSGAAGGYLTGKGKCSIDCVEGRWCVRRGDEDLGSFEDEDEAVRCALARDARDDPGEQDEEEEDTGRSAPPTIPPLPANTRTFTIDDLVGITCRSLADHVLILTEASVRDAVDLARGKV